MLPATLNQRSGFPIYTEHTLLWFRVNGDVELLPCLLFLPGYHTFTTLGVHIVTWPYLPNHIIYFRAIVLPLHIDSPRFWQTFCCLGLFNIFLIDKNIGCGTQVSPSAFFSVGSELVKTTIAILHLMVQQTLFHHSHIVCFPDQSLNSKTKSPWWKVKQLPQHGKAGMSIQPQQPLQQYLKMLWAR